MIKRTWKTKDGKRIKIRDMEPSHIKNCIKFLQRYNDWRLAQLYCWTSSLQGEMAQLDAENGLLNIEENGFEDETEDYIYTFEQELERRKGGQHGCFDT